jgi:hypothetical protein
VSASIYGRFRSPLIYLPAGERVRGQISLSADVPKVRDGSLAHIIRRLAPTHREASRYRESPPCPHVAATLACRHAARKGHPREPHHVVAGAKG